MAKKRRRNRGTGSDSNSNAPRSSVRSNASSEQETHAVAPRASETELEAVKAETVRSNVIQFPTKRAVASSQVAVNESSPLRYADEPSAPRAAGESEPPASSRSEPPEASMLTSSGSAQSPSCATPEPSRSAGQSEANQSEANQSEANQSEANAAQALTDQAKGQPAATIEAMSDTGERDLGAAARLSQAGAAQTSKNDAPTDSEGASPLEAPGAGLASKAPLEASRDASDSLPPLVADPTASRARGGRDSSTAAEILATGEHADVAEQFFRGASATEAEDDDFSDLKGLAEPMSETAKRAMYATGIIAGLGAALIGGMVYYNTYVMPQPVAVGHSGPLELPGQVAGSSHLAQARREAGRSTVDPAPSVTPAEAPAALEVPSPEPTVSAPTALGVATAEPVRTAAALDTPAAAALDTPAPAAALDTPTPAAALDTPTPAAGAPPAQTPSAEPVALAELPAPTAAAESVTQYNRLLARARRGPSGRRIATYQEALEINPAGAEAHSALAFLLLNRGQNQGAQEHAERATQLDRSDSLAWLVLGAAKQAQRDWQGAQAAYQSCVENGEGRHVRECRAMLR